MFLLSLISFSEEWFAYLFFLVYLQIMSFLFLLISFLSKVVSLPIVAIILLTGYFYGNPKERKYFYQFASVLIAVTWPALVRTQSYACGM